MGRRIKIGSGAATKWEIRHINCRPVDEVIEAIYYDPLEEAPGGAYNYLDKLKDEAKWRRAKND